jgi:putative ABC transport system substrate-binding protein
MRRRDLLSLAAGMAAFPLLPARAQQKKLPVVGYLSNGSAKADASLLTGLLKGLEQQGFVVGQNVAIEWRFAEGNNERVPSLAAELIGLPSAVLVAYGLPAAVPAKKATATIPIVFALGFDPVQLGLVASFNRPGGNATGVHMFQAQTISKRLELLREILPRPGLIAYLLPGRRTSAAPVELHQVETSAQAVGQPILVLQGHDEGEIDEAFATMAERQVSGVLCGASTYFQVIADKLVALAARYRIPASYEWREFVVAGGLMTYSASRREAMRLTGDYAGRILKGAAPAVLPVIQSTRFELVINMKTAKALGLTVPPALLARADEIIE